MSDIEYVQRQHDITQIIEETPEDYVKMEIITYDPSHRFITHPNAKSNSNRSKNTKETTFKDLKGWTGKDKSNFAVSFNYNAPNKGKYTFDILWAVPTKNKGAARTGKWKITLNGAKGKQNNYTILDDVFHRSRGVMNLKKGKNTFKIEFTPNMIILAVQIRKNNYYSGDTKNDFDKDTIPITLLDANLKDGGDYAVSELKATLMYSTKFDSSKTGTGLVFDYRDEVNFYIRDVKNKEVRVFGGYISNAEVDNDLTKITLYCADRLIDLNKRAMTTDITLAKGDSDHIKKNYSNYVQIMHHLCNTTENNLETNLNGSVGNVSKFTGESRKVGLKSIMSKKGYSKKVKTVKMTKKMNKNNITLKNKADKNSTQAAILWDANWTKKKTGVNIKDYPTFYIKYGMGAKPKKEKKPKKLKSGKLSKKSFDNITTGGYDNSKPLQAYIRIQFSIAKTGKKGKERHNAYIDFTKSFKTTGKHLGKIKPVLANNAMREGQLSIYNLLKKYSSTGDIYIKQIALINKVGKDKLYESKKDKSSCKMIIQSVGMKKGGEINPESLGTCGKTILDNMKNVGEKSGYRMKMEYGVRRHNDKAIFFIPNDIKPQAVFREDNVGLNNIISVSNIKYKPVSDMVNTSVKVYKAKKYENKDTMINKYVSYSNLDSILKYGEHMDIEVLSDSTSPLIAKHLAQNDSKFDNELAYSYTVEVENYIHLIKGDYVESIFYQKFLNDVKAIESIEINYDPKKIPMIRTSFGLDEVARNIRVSQKMQDQRKAAQSKNAVFVGGAEYDDNLDNLEW